MRSRYLGELNATEIEKYLADGGKTAILPVGCVEMHGPHLPICTDTYIAKAFSLLLADKANGLVLPEISYTWSGATDGFAGTISIEVELVQKIIESIMLKCMKAGFKRLILLSVHSPNGFVLYSLVRQLYEKYLFPVLFVDPSDGYTSEIEGIFAGDKEIAKESSILLGALSILGKGDLYKETDMNYDDKAPALPDSYRKMSRIGRTGYLMQDKRQHVCPSKYISLQDGLNFIKLQVEKIYPVLDEIDKYVEFTENQKNKGWNRKL